MDMYSLEPPYSGLPSLVRTAFLGTKAGRNLTYTLFATDIGILFVLVGYRGEVSCYDLRHDAEELRTETTRKVPGVRPVVYSDPERPPLLFGRLPSSVLGPIWGGAGRAPSRPREALQAFRQAPHEVPRV